MIERPVFKSTFHIEVVEPEGVFLLSEQGHFVLKGELYQHIAPLLDGRHTADEIVDALTDNASAAEVYYALGLMESRGYTAEAAAEIPLERAAFWHAAATDPVAAERRLQETAVALIAVGQVPLDLLADALSGAGLRVGPVGDFTIVVTDDYLQEGLAEINAAALASEKPWMLVKPVGRLLWVGPIFRPGVSACWECLAPRLRGNRPVESYLLERMQRQAPFPVSRSAVPASLQAAAQFAALQVVKSIGRGFPQPDPSAADEGKRENPGARGSASIPPYPFVGEREQSDATLTTLDALTLETRRHMVVRRPQCPRCGVAPDPYRREPLPLVLQPQPKLFTADGGHRTVSPEQTLAKYEPQVSSISGAVSLLARTPVAGAESVHVYISGYNSAMKADSLYFLRSGLRSDSAGKGVTDVQARASALCEAIERYSGEFKGDEIRRRATFRGLGKTAIHPNACMLYSEAQYANRAVSSAPGASVKDVTEPFDDQAEVDWTPVWSLTQRTFRYIPTGYCYYGYPMSAEARYCWADSNGSASGNTLEEAILQGFFELVERDSVALWWYNRSRRPAVDLDSFGERYTDQLRADYRRLGRELWVLDITSDLKIPVHVALSRRIDQPVEEILMGFGAHFDPRIALLRALTEMNQMLGIAGAVDREASEDDDPDMVFWMTTATVANQPYVTPNDAAPRRRTDYVDRSSDDIAEDVRRCQQIVEARGMEVLVLDQTRADIGLPVAKVIVPGLRHFWTRFAPGRLYDIPVEIGWLEKPLREDELNPIPMFM